MKNLLKTQRLEIRPLEDRDEDPLSELLVNDQIKKTFLLPDFETPEDLQAMCRRFTALSRNPERFVRGIYRENRLMGFVNDVEITGSTMELGYVIHPAFWGRGYATEMLKEVLSALLSSGFSAVRAGAFAENTASIRVMEKAGMEKLAHTDSIFYRGEDHLCLYYERRELRP